MFVHLQSLIYTYQFLENTVFNIVSFPFLYDISVNSNSLTRVVRIGVKHHRTFRHNHSEQPYTFHTQNSVWRYGAQWNCRYGGFVIFRRDVLRCYLELGHDHFLLLCNYSLIMPTSDAVNNLRFCWGLHVHHKCYFSK